MRARRLLQDMYTWWSSFWRSAPAPAYRKRTPMDGQLCTVQLPTGIQRVNAAGHPCIARLSKGMPMVKLLTLLRKGANANLADQDGKTAADLARQHWLDGVIAPSIGTVSQ
ncbi:hypothetical protein WJX72_004941 [[Myrmecia] bisecta]|uniref:Ankyrin repeat domain-containing protein n=1 Tax=[Myrmecia] bisecta TaxID=41462 RepID=A0AAW1R732_9CHLO